MSTQAGNVQERDQDPVTRAEAVLAQIPYFEPVPAAERRQLAAAAVWRRHEPGHVVFRQGEPAEGLHCVVRGRIKAVRYSPAGRELIIRFFSPFETFGEVGALEGGQNPSWAIAAEPSKTLLLPTASLSPVLRRYPEVAARLMHAMAHKLRYAMNRFAEVSLYDVKSRVAAFLLAQRESGQAVCRLTQDELAAMLGTVRQVLGRALSDLQEAGAIRLRRGAIEVVDPEALRDLAQLW